MLVELGRGRHRRRHHEHAHTAAVLDNPDGAVLSPMTGTADPDGYAGLLTLR